MITISRPAAWFPAVRPARRSDQLEAIVLAGGSGAGLMPLTRHRSPSVLPLMNRALIEHTIDGLKRAGVRHVVLALHHRAAEVIRHFLYRPGGVDLSFVTEPLPLDSAGAVRHCLPSVRGKRCFVVYGDIITDLNPGHLLSAHFREGAEISMALTGASDPVDADRGMSAGIFVFERTALERLPEHPASLEHDVLPALRREGVAIYGHRMEGYWARPGSPAEYLRVHHEILSGNTAVSLPACETSPGIRLGRGVELADDALLRAPVLIGDGARIEGGAIVGPFTILGNNVTVGRRACVHGSVLWDGTIVEADTRLVQCVIGERNRLSGNLHGAIQSDAAVNIGPAPLPSLPCAARAAAPCTILRA